MGAEYPTRRSPARALWHDARVWEQERVETKATEAASLSGWTPGTSEG